MQIPSIIYFSAFNFVLFVALLYFVLRKPAQQFFAERAKTISAHANASAEAEREVNARLADIQQRLAGIAEEIGSLKQQAQRHGEQERDAFIARAEGFAEKARVETQRMIEQELRSAKSILRQEAVDLALSSAQSMIVNNLSGADRDRLITNYVSRLEGTH